MCGRYALTAEEQQELEDFLNALDKGIIRNPGKQGDLFFATYNAPPTSIMPVCYVNDEGQRVIESAYWWFMKWPTKDGKPNFKYSTFNSRDDQLLKSNLWKNVIPDASKRCLVPMIGYYEFTGPSGNKTPHYFHPTKQKYFAAAGLISDISPNEGMKSYTIITTKPNAIQEPIHDRMPVLLDPDQFDDWLNPDHSIDYIMDMLQSYPEDAMETYVTSADLNSTRKNKVDEPYLIERATLL